MIKTFPLFFSLLTIAGNTHAEMVQVVSAPTPQGSQFISAVQFVVQESPQLMQRSQRVVREQFATHLQTFPGLQRQPFEQRTVGNEVVFYLVTDENMSNMMQEAVSGLIQSLNHRVRTRGLLSVYRTALSQPAAANLETEVNRKHTEVVSIKAESVPLRDLLKQLKFQLNSFSYLIPGECGDRRVNWSYGKSPKSKNLKIDDMMSQLALMFNLKVEKRNDTHIFNGECVDAPTSRSPVPPLMARSPFIPINTLTPTSRQVYFPLPTIGE